MRKVDYELLATIIAAEIEQGARQQAKATRTFTMDAALAAQQQATAMRIAEIFAHRASVNEKAFLAACGITS